MEGWSFYRGALHEYLASIPRDKWTEQVPPYKDTFIHIAVRLRDIVAIDMLIPVCLNIQDHLGNTPLHEACNWCDDNIISMLCAAGANVHIKNESGKTPFDICCRGGRNHEAAPLFMLYGFRLSSARKETVISEYLYKLESLILKHRSLVYAILFIAKNKSRDYRWDRFLLHGIARQVWELRFEASGYLNKKC